LVAGVCGVLSRVVLLLGFAPTARGGGGGGGRNSLLGKQIN